MEALLTNYSLTEILVFIVVLALAIKGTVSFYDWARERILKSVGKS
jgi:Tfp pilus assembly protein FimT